MQESDDNELQQDLLEQEGHAFSEDDDDIGLRLKGEIKKLLLS